MHSQNFNPVVAASIVAQHYMNPHLQQSQSSNSSLNIHNPMKGTLMVVMGAMAALQPTPTMMGYGSAKHAVHYFVESLGACTGGGIATAAGSDIYINLKEQPHTIEAGTVQSSDHKNNSNSGSRPLVDSKLVRQAGRSVRKDIPSYDYLTVVGLLPTMLDTPRNRQSLLQEQPPPHKNDDSIDEEHNFSTTLISPHDIAHEIGTWITTPALRPHSGALIKVLPPVHSNSPHSHHKSQNNNNNNNNNKAGARFELVR